MHFVILLVRWFAQQKDQGNYRDRYPHHEVEIIKIVDHRCLPIDLSIQHRHGAISALTETYGSVRIGRQVERGDMPCKICVAYLYVACQQKTDHRYCKGRTNVAATAEEY